MVALAHTRAALRALGAPGLVDAAGVVGLLNAIDRVAEATGIPLEPEPAAAGADFRADLDLDPLLGRRARLITGSAGRAGRSGAGRC
jgi:hypothetical protein